MHPLNIRWPFVGLLACMAFSSLGCWVSAGPARPRYVERHRRRVVVVHEVRYREHYRHDHDHYDHDHHD